MGGAEAERASKRRRVKPGRERSGEGEGGTGASVAPPSLFDESEDEGDELPGRGSAGARANQTRLRVNAEYAARHEHNEKRKELERLRSKYGDDAAVDEEEDSESTEDEDADGLTGEVEVDFLSTLAKIKSNDPTIYDPKHTFFRDSADGVSEKSNDRQKQEPSKPFTLRDHDRKRLQTKGALAFVPDGDEETVPQGRSGKLAFDAEQRKMRNALVKELHGGSDDEEEDGDFFSLKNKTDAEVAHEEADYQNWLAEEGGLDDETEEKLEPLRRFWTDPKLNSTDRFLRDFITKRQWRSDDLGGGGFGAGAGRGEGTIDLDDDAEHVEQAEQYERIYNFRYEDPDAAEVKSYPREIEGSIRRKKSTQRQEARERAAARKAEVKDAKDAEIRRLKNLKKQEILEKLKQVQEISGHRADGLEGVDLEKDFDPEEHDRQMEEAFGQEYYNDDEVDETKPVFSAEPWEDEYNEYDEEDYNDPEGDLNMDADFLDEAPAPAKLPRSQMKQLEQQVVAGNLEDAAKNNPELAKQLEDYFALDYEDIVGGIPTRFKYREVMANDYGLTTEELLAAEDKELNKWASLKKMVQYRSEEDERRDKKSYRKRRTDLKFKKDVFTETSAWSVTEKGAAAKAAEAELIANKVADRKKKKIQKKKALKEERRKERLAANNGSEAKETTASDTLSHKERRREQRRQLQEAYAAKQKPGAGSTAIQAPTKSIDEHVSKISDARLAAYKSGTVKLDKEKLKKKSKKESIKKK